jgi:hypothetical protein
VVGTGTIAQFLAEKNGERNRSELLDNQVARATSEAKRPTRAICDPPDTRGCAGRRFNLTAITIFHAKIQRRK